MKTIFSETLIQLRKDAGFSSAYQFYHGNGGKSALKMTYRNYLKTEQGKTLPELERMGTLIWALRIVQGSAEANAFMTAWIKTMAGEENFKALIAPLIAFKPGAPELSPTQKATKKALTKLRYYLTLEQIEAIHDTEDNYLCFLAISSDKGVWKTKEFANRLKLPEPAVKKALQALARVKLVKEVKKDAYKYQLLGALLTWPDMNMLPPELKRKISDCDKKLVEAGREVYPHSAIVRADERDFINYFPVLGVSISSVASYAITEKTDSSALFMVEGRITKLRDF